ncbi:RDD family protein [Acaricomes phytoseiuli]|uniref:RDD family protein n=1 Tax=Acaricomes phytoseiuli TaxID=291968 RepID=UPI000477A2F5|nr:RDD family protein [Acaricomes phytoseiuli]
MVNRSDLGSWMSGPDASHLSKYPGERLGLPQSGPRSIARAGRRIVAICIDWAIAMLISGFLFDGNPWATSAIFFLEQVLLIGTLGYSIGHRVMNIHVVRLSPDGKELRPAGPLAALVRAVLLLLVLPVIIVDADHRGLHDRARGTVLLRR